MRTAEKILLAIGAKKGLWFATSPDRRKWTVSKPQFLIQEIPSIGIDTRGGETRLMLGVRSERGMMAEYPSRNGSEQQLPEVSVLLPPVLAQLAGEQRRLRVPVTRTSTVGAVLGVLAAEYPILDRRVRDETGQVRRFVNVFVDGGDIRGLSGTTTPVSADQEVQII